MILIFDLDDTLYPEITYVHSGFIAVSRFLEIEYRVDYHESLSYQKYLLQTYGRGQIFDKLLERYNLKSRSRITRCLSCYRLHNPQIKLYPIARSLLRNCEHPLYLVTDGNKCVQQKKVKALDISRYFRRVLITHHFGIKNAKPSPYCFDLIRQTERVQWSSLVYVGDNPCKDFKAINEHGGTSIRVLTGSYRDIDLPFPYAPAHTVQDLSQLPALLNNLSHQNR